MTNALIIIGVVLGFIAILTFVFMWAGIAIMHMDSIDHEISEDRERNDRKAPR